MCAHYLVPVSRNSTTLYGFLNSLASFKLHVVSLVCKVKNSQWDPPVETVSMRDMFRTFMHVTWIINIEVTIWWITNLDLNFTSFTIFFPTSFFTTVTNFSETAFKYFYCYFQFFQTKRDLFSETKQTFLIVEKHFTF